MPSFRFQTLLDYRNRIVENRQIELATAQRHLAEMQAVLAQLLADRARFAEQLQRTLNGVLRIDEIEHQYRFLTALDQRIAEQRAQIQTAEESVEDARSALEAAMKDRKTLEKLQEYDEAALHEALRQREASALDDLNIARYSRGGTR